MATTLDTIAIEFGAQWTGGGIIQRIITDLNRVARATKDIYDPVKNTSAIPSANALASPFTHAGAAVLKYQTQLANVETQMRQLGQVMAGIGGKDNPFTSLAGDQQGQVAQYAALANQANALKDSIRDTAQAADGGAASIAGWVKTLAIAGAAIGVFVFGMNKLIDAFRAVKDIAQEGAGITQTAKSFEFLANSIYNTPELLDDMRRAARGTIPDLQLMSSYMTLVAGTTPQFGAALTSAIPQLLNIAKAANVLNPTLGDTTFFFESLARGIKRSEIRILDNLGLVVKVGQANKTFAANLGITVEQMTAEQKQMALLNETLRVGGLLIEQVGGNVTSLLDPYQQWDAATQNVSNSLKELTGIAFAPAIRSMADMGTALSEFAQEFSESIRIMSGQDVNFADILARNIAFMGPFIRSLDMMTDGIIRYNNAIGVLQGGGNIFEALGAFTEPDPGDFSAPFDALKPGTIRATTEAIRDGIDALAEWRESSAGFVAENGLPAFIDRVAASSGKAIPVAKDAASALRDLTTAALAVKFEKSFDNEIFFPEKRGGVTKGFNGIVNDLNRANQLIDQQLQLRAEMYQRWADIQNQAQLAQGQSWMDIFAGGEFNSDWIIGDIRNVGTAWVTTSNATREQSEKLAELNEEMGRAREKLWDLNNGIGVQGDDAEGTAKKISDLTAEISNYENVIAGIQSGITTTTSQQRIGINLDDVAIFKSFIDTVGSGGATAQVLSELAQGFNLVGESGADAMLKVSLIDGVLKNLDIQLKAGDIDTSEIPAAIQGVIAQIESDQTYAEIVTNVKVKVNEARATVDRELNLPEEDRTREISIGANLDPANRALASSLGMIEGSASAFKVEADTSPAMSEVERAVSAINNMTATLDIYGIYHAPADQPGGSAPGGGPRPQPFALGGYVNGSKGRAMAAIVHAGEFVLRPEAVDRLGVGFLNSLNRGMDSSNNVSVQNNFYGKVGGGDDVRAVILRSSHDAAEELADVLRRSGYKV